MHIRALLSAAAVAAASCLSILAPSSQAAVVTPVGTGVVQSATNGIVLGPDGNLWVAEQYNGSVAQLTTSGALVHRYAVGGDPKGVTTGPGGRVWVAGVGTGDLQLAWFDATAAAPSAHLVTIPSSSCPVVGVVAGGNGRMFFSLPSDGTCNGGVSRLGSVADTGLGPVTTASVLGPAYDLAVGAGKLLAPDPDSDVVRRFSLDAAPAQDSVISAPAGSHPEGITVDGAGQFWVTANGNGTVLRAPVTQSGGSMQVIVPTGGTLSEPFGIVAAPGGGVWAAGKASANLVRIRADGTTAGFVAVPDSEPFDLALGAGDEVFATDSLKSRVLRVVDGAPRAANGTATATAPTTATVTATVDPRGNATQVVVDYGTTTAYGASSAATAIAATAPASATTSSLTGLVPGTTYHARVRATNVLGTATGADTTFTTPVAPPGPKLGTAKASGGKTLLTSLKVPGLAKGDKVTVTCKGAGCPKKGKPAKAKKSGTLKLTALVKGAVLAPGAKVVVKVTSAGTTSTTIFTMVKGKKPTVG